MSELRKQYEKDLRARDYTDGTIERYVNCMVEYATYHWLSPDKLGPSHIREFMGHLDEIRGLATVSQKPYVSALKAFYRFTLERPDIIANIPWPRQTERKLPDILAGTEVEALLEAIVPIKHRVILTTAYGGGLRICEACRLKTNDIDSRRMNIHVRRGKGKKDRYVPLPERLLLLLREYWRIARPPGDYLFPGEKGRDYISEQAVNQALAKAVRKAKIRKRVTAHSLRHAFATHLLECGEDIRVIQHLLGHSSIRSTQIYTHMTVKHLGRIKSPLDRLGTPEARVLG